MQPSRSTRSRNRSIRGVIGVALMALVIPILPALASHSATFDYDYFTADDNDDGMGPHDANFNVQLNCGKDNITNTTVAHREVNNNNTALYIDKHPSTKECWIDNSVFDANGADYWGWRNGPDPGETWLATVWVKTFDYVEGGTLNGRCNSGGTHYGDFRARLTIHGEKSDGTHHWETNAWRCGGNDTFKRLDLKVTLDATTPDSSGRVHSDRQYTDRLRPILRANSRCCGDRAAGKVVLTRFRFVSCHDKTCSEWGYSG